tara:strand:- start:125 stop:388 length:264 start_codon:yes stop_codon:yes gene_type:complete
MDEIDQIDITFNDEEMKAVYENLKHWLRAMVEEDYSLEALSEVMSTYSLIHAYTYADHESVDKSIQSIKEKVSVNLLNGVAGEGIVH